MKKIINVEACGYSILVELLHQQEALNTTLALTRDESTQGYVQSVGPLVDAKVNLQRGDRVLLQGNYVQTPNPTDSGRKWGIFDLHSIKAILREE